MKILKLYVTNELSNVERTIYFISTTITVVYFPSCSFSHSLTFTFSVYISTSFLLQTNDAIIMKSLNIHLIVKNDSKWMNEWNETRWRNSNDAQERHFSSWLQRIIMIMIWSLRNTEFIRERSRRDRDKVRAHKFSFL